MLSVLLGSLAMQSCMGCQLYPNRTKSALLKSRDNTQLLAFTHSPQSLELHYFMLIIVIREINSFDLTVVL